MPNSERKKRPLGQVITTQKRKQKSEHTRKDAIGVETIESRSITQEEQYRILVQNIPSVIYSAYPGKTGPTTFISNKWKDWTGYSPEELYHDPEAWARCIHPDDREHTVDTYIKACRDRTAYNLEYRIVHKDTKQVRYVRDQGYLSKDEKGAVVRADGIITDITELKKAKNELDKYKDHLEELVRKRTAKLTSAYETLKVENKERKRAEQALREIEREKTTILENLSDLIVYRDSDMVTRWASKSMANWHGMSQEQINGRVCYKARYGLDGPCEECHVIEALKSGQRQELEKQLPGGRCWHAIVDPVFSDSGQVIGTIEVSQDITERKRANEELRKSKDILEKTFTSLDSAIFILDAKDPPVIIDCNPAATIIFGYGKEEMLGKTTEFLHVSRETLKEFQKALHLSIQEQGGLPFFEFKMQRKDGQVFPSEHSVRSLKDDRGRIIGWISVVRDITERKQSEEALRETTGLLETIFEHTHMLIACLDPQFNFVRVNRAYAEADERQPSFFIGRNHFDLYPNEENEVIFRRVVETGTPYFAYARPFEYAEHPERGISYWDWGLVPIKQQDGVFFGLVLTLANVTKQKRAEQALRESEERFRKVFEEGPIGMVLTSRDLKFFSANPAFCKMLGYTAEEMSSKTFLEVTHPAHRDADRENVEKMWRGEIQHYMTEKRYLAKNGDIRWGSLSTSLIRGQDGEPLYALAMVDDITDHKGAEDTLRQYEFMVESAHDAIFFKDRQSRYIIANEKTLESFGLSHEQVIGKSDYEIMPEREQAKQNIDDDQAVLETGKPKEIIKEMNGADGEKRWFQAIKVPQFDENGDVIGLIGIARDITKHKRADEELRIREQKLRALLNAPTESAILVDTEGTIQDINRIAAQRLGKSVKSLIGMGIYDYLHTDIAEYRQAQGYEVVRSGKPVRFQDGRKGRYYDNNIYPVFDDEGKVSALAVFSTDITERRQAEEALRISSDIVRSIPSGLFTYKYEPPDKLFLLDGNPAAERLANIKVSECIGKDFNDIWPQARNSGITDNFLMVMKTGKTYETEDQYYEDEKLEGAFRICAFPMSKELLGVAFENITQQKQAEAALRESEEKFRSLAEQSPNMIFINKKGKVVYANKKCEEVMGYKREELCSPDFDFRTLVTPESLDLINDSFTRHLKGQEVQPYDYTIISKEGMRIEVINASKLIQYEGQTAVLGIVTDITERKRAEQALRESEERLKILFESAPDTIYLIDSEGRFIDGNRAAFELIRFARDEVIGKSLVELDLLSAGQLSKAKANLKKVVAGKLSGPNEYILKRKDGTYISVEVRTFPVKIGGKILTLGIARDITERKRTEKELLEYQTKLKSLASQLSLTEELERHRLATDLHDQISQSLVISKIKLDQLRKSSSSDEINEPLEDISNCLGQIIDDTRTLTFDLSYPILYELGFEAAVAEWLTDQIQEKHGIKTKFEDDGRQKPLDDDIRVLLFRNVRELLINVVKHAHANKVKVSIRRVNEHINVSVEDDGVGFDPIEVTSMATKSAEFGLFSIRERLEQLGGLIEIDSEPGRGSVITMTAPLKYDSSTDRAQQ
jgi:PAS domain S-box-containing protein